MITFSPLADCIFYLYSSYFLHPLQLSVPDLFEKLKIFLNVASPVANLNAMRNLKLILLYSHAKRETVFKI